MNKQTDPTAEEIARACERIQARWTEQQQRSRAGYWGEQAEVRPATEEVYRELDLREYG